MKKNLKTILISLLLGLSFNLFAASDSSKLQYVTLDPAPLQEKASAASKKIGTVDYASAVKVIQEKKGWVFVSLADDPSVQGWLPATALTTKKIKAKGKAANADADEIALAGKGFNSTIEAVYADEYMIDFSDVNLMETFNSSDIEEIIDFAYEGNLNAGEVD